MVLLAVRGEPQLQRATLTLAVAVCGYPESQRFHFHGEASSLSNIEHVSGICGRKRCLVVELACHDLHYCGLDHELQHLICS